MKNRFKVKLPIIYKSKIVILTCLVAFGYACSPSDGVDGEQGIQGIRGEQGDQGIRGAQGDQGIRGEQGEQGIRGQQGADGIDGNANVKKYRITISTADWASAVHGGIGNVYHYYSISQSQTGGVSIGNPKYLTIAYGEPRGFDFNQTKLLPYTFGIDTDYGMKFEMDISRNRILMFKTTNGWDSSDLRLEEMPSSFIVDIFMIEVNAAMSAKAKIDLNNYSQVVDYFNLN